MNLNHQMKNHFLMLVISLGLLVQGCSTPDSPNQNSTTQAQSVVESTSEIVTEELKVPSIDQDVSLYVRHMSTKNKEKFTNNEVVLFLEPFSVPTAQAFDVPGYSWMEEYAKQGYDTWAMDFRGFGHSTRPVEMDQPPVKNAPVVRATEAVKDLEAVVQHIKKTRQVDKISIVGWSWGGVVAGMYATEHSDDIEKLVLYGVMHGFSLPLMATPFETKGKPGEINPQLPAYQVVQFDKAMHHWHMMLDKRDLVSGEAMNAVSKVFVNSDPNSSKQPEQSIRRPMGPLVDLYYIWTDKPIFDAAKITTPVLIIRGDLDFFADKSLFHKLTHASAKQEVVIKDATHWVLYEKNRDQLLRETDEFLKKEVNP
ncbi:alpha/beta hydrolase [Brevibacillus porteri]|uniref:alpha/beta hydrolase n=1 Tax=Brevibacillus porteri TaxID=2126350 RepID=UPI003D232F75